MSIWASIDLVDCWTPHCTGCDECTLGKPYQYVASNVLPEPGMARADTGIDCAFLSKFVRHYRDNPDSIGGPDGNEPWLRFGIGPEVVILDAAQVRQMVDRLTEWLEGL